MRGTRGKTGETRGKDRKEEKKNLSIYNKVVIGDILKDGLILLSA